MIWLWLVLLLLIGIAIGALLMLAYSSEAVSEDLRMWRERFRRNRKVPYTGWPPIWRTSEKTTTINSNQGRMTTTNDNSTNEANYYTAFNRMRASTSLDSDSVVIKHCATIAALMLSEQAASMLNEQRLTVLTEQPTTIAQETRGQERYTRLELVHLLVPRVDSIDDIPRIAKKLTSYIDTGEVE